LNLRRQSSIAYFNKPLPDQNKKSRSGSDSKAAQTCVGKGNARSASTSNCCNRVLRDDTANGSSCFFRKWRYFRTEVAFSSRDSASTRNLSVASATDGVRVVTPEQVEHALL
jgi:hypothetical protein